MIAGIVFISAVLGIGLLWKDYVAAPTMVGQAEPILAQVSCFKPGVLAEFTVTRFQKVKAGDPLGLVMVTDPRILTSSLAVIQAEIDLLRVNMKPIVEQQRNAMDYGQLRLDWMQHRTQLATARINLQLAETEYRRMDELFRDKIIAQRAFEQAKGARERLQSEVEELARVVKEGEESFKQLQLTNSTEISTVSSDPLLAAIAVQESKLRLTEAELSPIPLKAPVDGVINAVYCRVGRGGHGRPIHCLDCDTRTGAHRWLSAAPDSERTEDRDAGARSHPGMRRPVRAATVLEVGAQLEAMPAALLGPIGLAHAELALPVDISMPSNLRIRPGELVDITLTHQVD